MSELTKVKIRKCNIDKWSLIKGGEQSMYVYEVIAISTIMETRLSKPETIKFRSELRFNQINLILKKNSQ